MVAGVHEEGNLEYRAGAPPGRTSTTPTRAPASRRAHAAAGECRRGGAQRDVRGRSSTGYGAPRRSRPATLPCCGRAPAPAGTPPPPRRRPARSRPRRAVFFSRPPVAQADAVPHARTLGSSRRPAMIWARLARCDSARRATINRHPTAMGALKEHRGGDEVRPGLGPERRECRTPIGRRRAISERSRTDGARSQQVNRPTPCGAPLNIARSN